VVCARHLSRIYDRHLAPAGLSISQYSGRGMAGDHFALPGDSADRRDAFVLQGKLSGSPYKGETPPGLVLNVPTLIVWGKEEEYRDAPEQVTREIRSWIEGLSK